MRSSKGSRRPPIAWTSWVSARTARRGSRRSRAHLGSVRRSGSEVGTVADPQTGWCSEQHRQRVQPWRVLGALLREAGERIIHRPDREAVILHVLEHPLELVALDHGL